MLSQEYEQLILSSYKTTTYKKMVAKINLMQTKKIHWTDIRKFLIIKGFVPGYVYKEKVESEFFIHDKI